MVYEIALNMVPNWEPMNVLLLGKIEGILERCYERRSDTGRRKRGGPGRGTGASGKGEDGPYQCAPTYRAPSENAKT